MNIEKYTIKLIPMKSHKKATVFVSYGKVTGRYQKSFPKPSKGVFTIAVPFKSNASLCWCFPVFWSHQGLQETCPPP